MTGWTWVKYERAEGQKFLPQLGCGHKIEDKMFPCPQVEGCRAGTQTESVFQYSYLIK
jgi:hypothetical protein